MSIIDGIELDELRDKAAQADLWKARVEEAAGLIEPYREALVQIAAVCDDNLAASCNHHMALEFVRSIVWAVLVDEQETP